MKSSIFWDIKPCKLVKFNPILEKHMTSIFMAEALLAVCFMLLSCLAYSLTLKMVAICSPETFVDFHQTTLNYILEDRTFEALYNLLFNTTHDLRILNLCFHTLSSSIEI
jgi:hypothetical protein